MDRYQRFRIKRNIETPWLKHLYGARGRCKDKHNSYLLKGIKCFLTKDEVKELWYRDQAYLMKKPSIDRIDTTGNYEFFNCRFLEWEKNKVRPRMKISTSSNKFKGVYWQPDHKKFRVIFANNGKQKHIGYFSNQEEAALIYNQRVSEFFKEDICINKV